MSRLKSCQYCGRIHSTDYRCPNKPVFKSNRERTEEDRMRGFQVWKKKRKAIKDRDLQMCQVCKRNLYNTTKQYNTDDVQVHHIVSMKEDIELWLEDTNLVCLCKYHHEQAEAGRIPKKVLKKIVEEQETIPPLLYD